MTTHQFRPRKYLRRSASRKQLGLLYFAILAAIGLQISYPLVHGDVLLDVTLATVYVGAAAMIFHAFLVYGPLFSITFTIITFGYGLAIDRKSVV